MCRLLFFGLLYCIVPVCVKAEILWANPDNQDVKTLNRLSDWKPIKNIRSAKNILQNTNKYKIHRPIFQKWKKNNGVDFVLILALILSLSLCILTVIGLVWIAQFIAPWLTVLLVVGTLLLALTGLIFILTV